MCSSEQALYSYMKIQPHKSMNDTVVMTQEQAAIYILLAEKTDRKTRKVKRLKQ